jgi:hypothetical protein
MMTGQPEDIGTHGSDAAPFKYGRKDLDQKTPRCLRFGTLGSRHHLRGKGCSKQIISGT